MLLLMETVKRHIKYEELGIVLIIKRLYTMMNMVLVLYMIENKRKEKKEENLNLPLS